MAKPVTIETVSGSLTAQQRLTLELWAAEYEKLSDQSMAPNLSPDSRFWKGEFAKAVRAALVSLDTLVEICLQAARTHCNDCTDVHCAGANPALLVTHAELDLIDELIHSAKSQGAAEDVETLKVLRGRLATDAETPSDGDVCPRCGSGNWSYRDDVQYCVDCGL
jgi:hypothetical protein